MNRNDGVETLLEELEDGRIDRRTFFQRAAAAGLAMSVAGALADSAAGRSVFGEAKSKTLRLHATTDMHTLDPAFYPGLTEYWVNYCCLEGLVTYKPGTWEVVNQLAATFEPSRDGLRYHFTLKRGIPFHGNYGELTAEDVKYSYERIAGLTKPNLHAVYQGDWAALSHVKIESKYAGTIVLKRPFVALMRSTLPVSSGWVISKKAVEHLGKKFATHVIGTGPYEFKEWVPQQKIVLTRFTGYGGASSAYARKPEWDSIEFVPIADYSAAETALQAGDLDFAALPTSDVDTMSRNSKFDLYRRTTPNFGFIAMNVLDPQLKNINLRRAIRSAIDVPAIISAAFDGKWTQANAIIPKSMGVGYWPGAPKHTRDVALAKSYLQKSGLSNLSLNMAVANKPTDKTIAQVVQQNLADLGIKLNIAVQDDATWGQVPGPGQGGQDRQLVYSYYQTEPDPSWSFVWFTCAQVKLWNLANWCDPKFTTLYNQALTTQNSAKRTKLYIDMQKLWDANANTVWVGYQTAYFAGKKNIRPMLQPDGQVQAPWFRSV